MPRRRPGRPPIGPKAMTEVERKRRQRAGLARTHAQYVAERIARLKAQLAELEGRSEDGRCRFVEDDGGRSESGIARGSAKDATWDCVVRSIAIATGKPYRNVHDGLTGATVRFVANAKDGWGKQKRRSVRDFHADHGVHRDVSGPYLQALGWKYTSTKELPRGRGMHLRADELPRGRLIVDVRRHWVAVIDGVLHDTIDCSDDGRRRILGYWSPPGSA
jgi:hypothetical protein